MAFDFARLTDGDKYYILARTIGEQLARLGYLVRTGKLIGVFVIFDFTRRDQG